MNEVSTGRVGLARDGNINDRESKAFYILKAFAIYSVMIAHLSDIVADQGWLVYGLTRAAEPLACLGVPAFLAVSGFFYRRRPGDTVSFWKKKLVFLILPWLVAGLLRNLVDILLAGFNGMETVWYYLQRMVGLNSSFYFPALLIMMFLLFKWTWNRPWFLWLCVAVTAVSLVVERYWLNGVSELITTPYLNPLNWCGFFALGILARRYRWDREICEHRYIGWSLVGVSLAWYGVMTFFIPAEGYFSPISALFEVCGMAALYFLSYGLAARRAGVLTEVGSCTYCIYLYHLLIIRSFFALINMPAFLMPLRPVLGLIIMQVLIEIGKWVCKRLLKIQWPMTLVGLKG